MRKADPKYCDNCRHFSYDDEGEFCSLKKVQLELTRESGGDWVFKTPSWCPIKEQEE